MERHAPCLTIELSKEHWVTPCEKSHTITCLILLPTQVLEPSNAHVYREMTLGHYLKQNGYSHGFIYNYVVPMCAAVWSVPTAQVILQMMMM